MLTTTAAPPPTPGTTTDYSERLSRKVLASLKTLNESLVEVRRSVAKIDTIANKTLGSSGVFSASPGTSTGGGFGLPGLPSSPYATRSPALAHLYSPTHAGSAATPLTPPSARSLGVGYAGYASAVGGILGSSTSSYGGGALASAAGSLSTGSAAAAGIAINTTAVATPGSARRSAQDDISSFSTPAGVEQQPQGSQQQPASSPSIDAAAASLLKRVLMSPGFRGTGVDEDTLSELKIVLNSAEIADVRAWMSFRPSHANHAPEDADGIKVVNGDDDGSNSGAHRTASARSHGSKSGGGGTHSRPHTPPPLSWHTPRSSGRKHSDLDVGVSFADQVVINGQDSADVGGDGGAGPHLNIDEGSGDASDVDGAGHDNENAPHGGTLHSGRGSSVGHNSSHGSLKHSSGGGHRLGSSRHSMRSHGSVRFGGEEEIPTSPPFGDADFDATAGGGSADNDDDDDNGARGSGAQEQRQRRGILHSLDADDLGAEHVHHDEDDGDDDDDDEAGADRRLEASNGPDAVDGGGGRRGLTDSNDDDDEDSEDGLLRHPIQRRKPGALAAAAADLHHHHNQHVDGAGASADGEYDSDDDSNSGGEGEDLASGRGRAVDRQVRSHLATAAIDGQLKPLSARSSGSSGGHGGAGAVAVPPPPLPFDSAIRHPGSGGSNAAAGSGGRHHVAMTEPSAADATDAAATAITLPSDKPVQVFTFVRYSDEMGRGYRRPSRAGASAPASSSAGKAGDGEGDDDGAAQQVLDDGDVDTGNTRPEDSANADDSDDASIIDDDGIDSDVPFDTRTMSEAAFNLLEAEGAELRRSGWASEPSSSSAAERKKSSRANADDAPAPGRSVLAPGTASLPTSFTVIDTTPPCKVQEWFGGDVTWPAPMDDSDVDTTDDGDGGEGASNAGGSAGADENVEGDAAAGGGTDSISALARGNKTSASKTAAQRANQLKRLHPRHEAFALRIVYQAGKTGFEEDKEFSAAAGAVIAGRYVVNDFLGSAAFSSALSCTDLSTGEDVCLKVIKNSKEFLDQSLDEIKLLRYINAQGDADANNVLRLKDYFYHKEHLFLVTELLKDNLYEFQRYLADTHQEPYFNLPRIQAICKQVLTALNFIHSKGLLHWCVRAYGSAYAAGGRGVDHHSERHLVRRLNHTPCVTLRRLPSHVMPFHSV